MKADAAMLDKLRAAGATIGPTAGERLAEIEAKIRRGNDPQIAQMRADSGGLHVRNSAQSADKQKRSTIRRMKSKTENRFANWLDSCPEICKWRYEAIRFQLAEHDDLSITYTPDFTAWLAGGRRRFYEVKSRFERDSDTESRLRFVLCRQQHGDENHEFRAYREGEAGNFFRIWEGPQ